MVFYLHDLDNNSGREYNCCCIRAQPIICEKKKVDVVISDEAGNPRLPVWIDGSVEKPRWWLRITERSVDQFNFRKFMEYLCDGLERNPVPNGMDMHMVFLLDNLSVCKTAYATHRITAWPSKNCFEFVDRPYIPKISQIEYVVCELAAELSRRINMDWTIDHLKWNIRDIVSRIGMNGTSLVHFIIKVYHIHSIN